LTAIVRERIFMTENTACRYWLSGHPNA
jgi:hypothetical protein